jgi:hypothetical protein
MIKATKYFQKYMKLLRNTLDVILPICQHFNDDI